MVRKQNNNSKKYINGQYILAGVLLIIIIIIGVIFWLVTASSTKEPGLESNQSPSEQTVSSGNDNQLDKPPRYDALDLQEIVDEWAGSAGGSSSVYMSDVDGNIVASSKPSDVYFAASIYKLFVAYAGYGQVDSGEVDPSEIYVNGYTRAECLDLMIRDSYSPCAEKLWNELGKAKLTAQLKAYGIMNTSMEALTTTAMDASIMLARIARGEGLSDESRDSYLSSMKDQEAIYRRGLPSGFKTLVVYNKVGWNEQKEWHDTAIIELPDGRQLILSVFSENVGSSNIAKLGMAIEAIVQ